MPEAILGYGEYKGYRLQEIPDPVLQQLGVDYPLSASAHEQSGRDELYVTVAIHEEIQRRAHGGKPSKHRLTAKEFALDLVKRGFHELSKIHHPDRNGDNESQRALTSARDFLRDACAGIEEQHSESAVIIRERAVAETGITDEDIPF